MKATARAVPNTLPSTPTAQLFGHEGPVRSLKFSSCGKYCISGGHDRTVRLWNPTRIDPASQSQQIGGGDMISDTVFSNEKILDKIPHALPIQVYDDGHTHPISAIDIDNTSTKLISASEKTLVITDVISRKLKRRFQGHTGRINTVACSSGGDVYASGSYDGTVRLWDGRSGSQTPIQILSDATDSISSVKILQEESAVVEILSASIDGCVRTYDIRRGMVNCDNFGNGKDIALTCVSNTSDKSLCAVSCLNGAVHITERSTGALLNTCFGGHTAGRYSLECSFTSNDKHIVQGSENGITIIYDYVTGDIVQSLEGQSRATCTVACHPHLNDSSVVITGSYDGTAIVWSNGNPKYLSFQ